VRAGHVGQRTLAGEPTPICIWRLAVCCGEDLTTPRSKSLRNGTLVHAWFDDFAERTTAVFFENP
jgi:hypothetical protein